MKAHVGCDYGLYVPPGRMSGSVIADVTLLQLREQRPLPRTLQRNRLRDGDQPDDLRRELYVLHLSAFPLFA